MPENVKYSGICSTCRHAPTCTYPRDPRRPVLCCEEFEIEIGEPRRVEFSGKDLLSSGQPSAVSGSCKDDSARYKGLCSDCENRKSCTYPKPEGGVWHCEEYQ